MKKIYLSLGLILLALAFTAQDASAQIRYVDVEPGIGTLNDAINGDTTETGARVDTFNTVYRLQRGLTAYYGLTGSIENRYPLTIVAEEGDGPRPFLQPVDEGAGSSRAFRARDHITLRSLHVTNMDDLGGINTRMLRASAEDIRIVLDDCWFDEDGQSFIRCDDPGMKIYVTNSVISDIGQPSSPNNGRGIDDRGNDIDTVWFENCTFYNITSRIIRDGGGQINYARFNNNTVYNLGQMGITFGPAEKVEVWSNLFVNVGLMPTNDSARTIFGVDSIQVDETTTEAPEILWNNNLIYFDSTLVADYMNDTLFLPALVNEDLGAWYAENYGNTPQVGAMLEFNDQPPFPDSLIIYDIYPEFDQANAPGWDKPEVPADPDGNGIYHAVVPYDFGYTNQVAYSLGFGADEWGGDNNWEAMGEDFEMVDFEAPWERAVWNMIGNDTAEYTAMKVIPNPDPTGANTSSMVMQFDVLASAQSWAGAYSDAYGAMTFTQEMHHMEMMVWKDKVSDCGLKVEVGGTVTELKVPNTLTSQWEAVQFDFSANIGETLTRLVFFPDFSDRDADVTAYVDNIRIIESPVNVEEDRAESLSIYPNPATDQLMVRMQGMRSVVIRDVLGKAVMSLELQGQESATLNVSELVEGVYFISVDTPDGISTSKFLKR